LFEEDREGLAALVGKLATVDHPERDPDIVLDPRGSDYQKQVWSVLREIPSGETTTYGALATAGASGASVLCSSASVRPRSSNWCDMASITIQDAGPVESLSPGPSQHRDHGLDAGPATALQLAKFLSGMSTGSPSIRRARFRYAEPFPAALIRQ
jgi:hypothetical protein